jgi:hypothetical protein
MKLPLTPIRCLYRGVDLYGEKVGVVSGRTVTRTHSLVSDANV